MPELPEVETVVNNLKKFILNKVIENVEVYYEKILKNINALEFSTSLINEEILDILRIGKYIVFVTTSFYLLSHLRMEGKYYYQEKTNPIKHEHIIFNLTDGMSLRYNDTRKFGCMFLYNKTSLIDLKTKDPLKGLGYEAMEPNLNVEYLKLKILKSRKSIKTLLLDQKIISGLGNIYADEVLFSCKLNPNLKGYELNELNLADIISNSRAVLEKAIELGGTTIRTFSVHEISGRFQNELNVHTKTKCLKCNSKIIKIYIGKRGTYYCPSCQR